MPAASALQEAGKPRTSRGRKAIYEGATDGKQQGTEGKTRGTQSPIQPPPARLQPLMAGPSHSCQAYIPQPQCL